jgi:hypothetical protein
MPGEEQNLQPVLFEQKEVRRIWHKGDFSI